MSGAQRPARGEITDRAQQASRRTASQDGAQLLTAAINKPSVFIRLEAKAPDEILY